MVLFNLKVHHAWGVFLGYHSLRRHFCPPVAMGLERWWYAKHVHYAYFESPLGWLTLVSSRLGLRSLSFGRIAPSSPDDSFGDSPETQDPDREALAQLAEYFEGRRVVFDLDLDLRGTPFQLEVWHALMAIPFGETRTYGEIARGIGKPGAARAVGMANHRNPVAIIVPCHRVIGSDGSLTGYASGIDVKASLLAFERAPNIGRSEATWRTARGFSTAAAVLS